MPVAIIKFTIESKVENLPIIGNGVMGVCSHIVEDLNKLYMLQLAIIEVLNNIIEHAYKNEAGHFIDVVMKVEGKIVTFEISDSGSEKISNLQQHKELNFDPNNIENLPESGMGLHIIHKVMDEVVFRHDKGKNITYLKKTL